jgi:hypothetical protein
LFDIKEDLTTTWDVTLKTSIENNIDEDNKNATLNHPLYDDEFKSTIEENIHHV